MPQDVDSFMLKFESNGTPDAEIPEENLHEIFGLVERKQIQEPVEIYQGATRVARMQLAKNGIWQIDWHPDR